MADQTNLDITLQPVRVDTASDDQHGKLVFANGKLVAVLVRLASEAHGKDRGSWFCETGFGPCNPPAGQVFGAPDDALDWVRQRIAVHAALAARIRAGAPSQSANARATDSNWRSRAGARA